jgi:hypothetical protein
MSPRLGVRWTIGNVSDYGFEALRLSIWGMWNIFGTDAAYAVCYNSVPLTRVRQRTGDLPCDVEWINSEGKIPDFILERLDRNMAEGVGWKFGPLRVFENQFELSLDNDCILWDLPPGIRALLESCRENACVIAEDVRPCFGQFANLCGSEPRNSGIRGISPGFNLEKNLRDLLRGHSTPLSSETDEQGLQIAALLPHRPEVVRTAEVTICSPFPPHLPYLGTHGVHFVGLNAKKLPWLYYDRPAEEVTRENWFRLRQSIYEKVGARQESQHGGS